MYRPRYVHTLVALQRHLHGRREVIADLGCSFGVTLWLAAKLGFSRFLAADYYWWPPDQSFLSDLRNVTELRVNFNDDRFLASVPDASADCAVSSQVLEHVLHHPVGYLEECWRILRPGGLLVIDVPNPATLANAWRVLRGDSPTWGDVEFARTAKLTGDRETTFVAWDIHFREYSSAALRLLVSELPNAAIIEQGFVATASVPGDSPPRRAAKRAMWALGLGTQRLVASAQYLVARRGLDRS